MSKELIISPRSERLREELADAGAWSSYAAALRQVLAAVIAKSGIDFLEVGELLVNDPLPDRRLGLRNGTEVQFPQAIDLVEGMAAGRGPYCRLSLPGWLQIESGWDGAVHLYLTRAVAADLARLRCQDAILQWRDAAPEPTAISNPVGAVADEDFWEAVAKASERFTLVCERWAYGASGCLRVPPGASGCLRVPMVPRKSGERSRGGPAHATTFTGLRDKRSGVATQA